jgi:hypothetical protein
MIGALVIGFVLALALSGLYTLWRRKASDPFTLMTGLMVVGMTASMALTIGYAREKYGPVLGSRVMRSFAASVRPPQGGKFGQAGPWQPGSGAPHLDFLGSLLLKVADTDQDGHLTPEEAASFVRTVDSQGKGWADLREINSAWAPKKPRVHANSARPSSDRG